MDDVEALSTIVSILKGLDDEAQKRVLTSVEAFLGISSRQQLGVRLSEVANSSSSPSSMPSSFSTDRTISPKEFVRDKNPATDVDRVACLAYYLTHFRALPHFKTLDISSLNVEAAQPKFSSASVAVDNARAKGLLVPSTKGNKQLSAAGERYVELLPDKDAAMQVLQAKRKKSPAKRPKGK
jgi:hypothetical protein